MKINKYLTLLGAVTGTVLAGGAASALTPGANNIVTDTDTLTINQVADSGDTFKACKIIDVKYDSANNTVEYAFTTAFTTWQNSLESGNAFKNITVADYMGYADGTASGSQISGNATIDQLAGKLASDSAFTGSCKDMTTSGTSATATVPYGAYLIVPKARNDATMSKSYGAMIANLAVKAENGSYVVDKTHATLDAKAGNVGTVIKESKKNGTATDSFAIDEVFQYEITANAPIYPANASVRRFAVKDNMESGMTFDSYGEITSGGSTYVVDTADTSCNNNSSPCIKLQNSSTVVGYVIVDGNNRTYAFNDMTVTPSPIVITYNAHLDNDATLGNKSGNDSVNDNSALIMTPKSYYDGTNSGWEEGTPSTVTVYTFGIRVNKYGENNTPISGAKFNICADANCSTVVGMLDMSSNNTKEYKSLAEGTYYLKETQAPTGYKLLSTPTTMTIARNSSPSDGYFVYAVTNEKAAFALPFTGGRGVLVYAILGVSIVAIASAVYTRKKKQQA